MGLLCTGYLVSTKGPPVGMQGQMQESGSGRAELHIPLLPFSLPSPLFGLSLPGTPSPTSTHLSTVAAHPWFQWGCNRHWLVWLSIGWHWAGIGLVISTLGVLHDTFEILSTGGGYCWVSGIGPYSLKNLWRVTIVRFKKERDKMYGGYSHSRLK